MRRVHFLQHWYGYSDPAMEDALHDMPALRRFVGLDAGESRMQAVLEASVFHSLVALQAAIKRYLVLANDYLRPFQWTKDPDKIIAAVRRGHQALDPLRANDHETSTPRKFTLEGDR